MERTESSGQNFNASERRYQESKKVTQAFQNVEKAFSGSAEAAGFHMESELQDYVTKIR